MPFRPASVSGDGWRLVFFADIADKRITRPKVERKIGHLMRRRHGGRRARVRGQAKVAADFALLAAAINLARLAVLGVTCQNGTRPRPGHERPRPAAPATARRRAGQGQAASRTAPARPQPRTPPQPAETSRRQPEPVTRSGRPRKTPAT